MNASDRVFGLDLLRALAISFVVVGHASYLLPPTFPHHILDLVVFDGVTIFFVLSGFLIGRILFRTLDEDPPTPGLLVNFWIRRWFRTLPAYYLVLVLLIALTRALGDDTPPMPQSIGWYFAFAQNLAWEHPAFFGEAWSLAVEEWFYLVVPIPIYLACKEGGKQRHALILSCIAAVMIAATAVRLARVMAMPPQTVEAWNYLLKMQVVTRMDSLMFGVLGAYLSLYASATWTKSRFAALVTGVVLLLVDQAMRKGPYSLAYLNHLALTVTPLATLLLLPALSSWRRAPSLSTQVVTFISLISYSMYLLNQAPILETLIPWLMPRLMHLLWRFTDHAIEIRFALYWIMTVGGSYLLYRYVEQPAMRLRDRWPFQARREAVSA